MLLLSKNARWLLYFHLCRPTINIAEDSPGDHPQVISDSPAGLKIDKWAAKCVSIHTGYTMLMRRQRHMHACSCACMYAYDVDSTSLQRRVHSVYSNTYSSPLVYNADYMSFRESADCNKYMRTSVNNRLLFMLNYITRSYKTTQKLK